MTSQKTRWRSIIAILLVAIVMLSALAIASMAAVAEAVDFLVYGVYVPSHSVYAVEGYGNLLYYDDGTGVCHIVRVSIPAGADPNVHPDNPEATGPVAPRTFAEIGTYDFEADCGWSASHQAEFYVDENYIYYGPTGGIEKWAKNPDGTFGAYLGRLEIPVSNKGQTLAYDADNDSWYTCTSSRAVYSFEVGVDTEYQYEFTYPQYGKGQGHHGGVEFIGGYLWVSEMNTDYIGQWKYTGSGPYNGWQEVNRFIYTHDKNVEGLGFGPLNHFWASSGVWKKKGEPPEIYEIGGAPTKVAAGFTWTPEPQNEGSPVGFTDTSAFWPDVSVSWSWDFGDGKASAQQNPSHTYGDDGIYTASLTATSGNGLQDTVSHNVAIINVAPTVEAGTDQAVDEGEAVSFSGSFTDPAFLDTHTLEWDFGDGSTASGTLTPTHTYGDNGTYTVTLTVTDDDGGVGTDTLTVIVNNVAPVIDANGFYLGDEGGPITFTATATDEGSDDLTFTWDWGDGTQTAVTTYYNNGSGPDLYLSPLGIYPFSATDTVEHTYGDNGGYTVTLTVTDDDEGVWTDTLTVTVLNVAPIAEAGPDRAADEGETVTFSGSFTDPGWLDTHTVEWGFGDGSTACGTLTPTHTYAYKGTYSVTLIIMDDDGGVGKDVLTIYVPVGMTVSVQPTEVPSPSDAQYIPLQDIPLQDIPLQDIPLQDIPLRDISVQASPLQDIPLQDIPLQDINWEVLLTGTSLEGIPLQDITLGDLLLAGIPLQDITLADIFLAGIPLQDISVGAAPLQDIPLQDIPLQDITWQSILMGTPLQDIPLQDISLRDLLLAGVPLQDIPLQDINILGTPLQYIPLQDIPLQDITWESILVGTPLQDIPLQDITLGDLVLVEGIPLQDITLLNILLVGVPLQDIPLQDIPLQDINILGTPLQDIPLQDIPLQDITWDELLEGTIWANADLATTTLGDLALAVTPLQDITLNDVPLQDIPLQDIPLQDISIVGTPLQDIPLQDIPLQDITWESILMGTPLQDIPLQDITLGDLVLAGVPLQDITLADIVAGVPLQDIPLQDIPILNTPLQDIPLQDISVDWGSILAGTVFEGIDLTETTLGDIALAGIPLQDITLRDALMALIPLQDIPWEAVPLQDIPLEEVLVLQNGVTYTITVANYGNVSAQNVVVTHTLPDGFEYVAESTTGATTTDPTIEGQNLTWDSFTVPASTELVLNFEAIATISLGTYFSDVSATSNLEIPPAIDAAPVTVIDTFEVNDSWEQAYGITADRLYFSYISTETDVDWYRIPVPVAKGSMVTVYLSHLPADYDLVLFAGVEELPTDIPLQDIPLQDIPLQDIPLQDIPLQDIPFKDIPLQDIPLQDIPFKDIPLQDIPLQDISIERGTTDEIAGDRVVNEAGHYYILISGYNGTHSNEPYLLRVKVTPPPEVELFSRDLPPPGAPGIPYGLYGADTETIIVTNQQRLGQYYSEGAIYGADGLRAKLDAFAKLNNVKGMILPVDYYQNVSDAYAAWDANAGDPEAANAVAVVIRKVIYDIINETTDGSTLKYPNIQYVVIVGSDEIVPFRRVPDEVYLSNESTYAAKAHLKPSALYASLVHGYILTDDYYVDMAPVPWMGRELYVPDYAIGRLVETPEEIIGMLDEFVANGGVLEAGTALVTGYDFLSDGANAIVDTLQAQGLAPLELISETWTTVDLASLLLDSPAYDLNSINAHCHHWGVGPPVGDPFYSNQILASYLEGKLVFSMGCHAGLSVDDSVSEPGDWTLDLPQAFAQKAAWLVGNTGYGYGDSDIVALSEELMRNFAEELGAGESVPVGQALVNAKQDYFLSMGSYGPFDEKIMIEAALYGLPMYQIIAAPLSPQEEVGTPLVITVNRWVNFELVDSLTEGARLLVTTTQDGLFYSADGETQFIPYRPIQPRTSIEIEYPSQVAHGTVFTSGVYMDLDGFFDPVIARPIDDHSLYEPQIINEAWYPSKLQTIVALETPGGAVQNLVVVPGQFITTSSNTYVTGIERLYTSLNYDIYYSTSKDYTPPIIELADVTIRGMTAPFTAYFSVKVSDANDPAIPDDGSMRRVVVTWTYTTGDTTWESIDLQYDSTSGTWIGELPGLTEGETDFIVQAVDYAGNVGLSASKGFFFTPIPVEAGDNQIVNEGATVSFLGNIGGAPEALSILWDFGDGSVTEDILNPTHVYTDDGVYTVTFRVTNGKGGSGWDTLEVTVLNVVPIVQVPEEITVQYTDPVGLVGNFTDPGSRDTHTYHWNISTDPVITIWGNLELTVNWLEWLADYPEPGTYIATLTVMDDDGGVGQDTCLVTISKEDTVLSSPQGEIVYSDETTVEVTLRDDDGEVLIHQTDSPKTVYLEYRRDATSPWVVISEDVLASANDTDDTLTFSLAIPDNLDEPTGNYDLRARFDGDTYYNPTTASGLLTILKESVVITVPDKEGFSFDAVTLEATIVDNDSESALPGPYVFSFMVGDHTVGNASIDVAGHVQIEWVVDLIPLNLVETYPVIVSIVDNGYYEGPDGRGTFTVYSPRYVKSGVLPKLESAKTADPQVGDEIDHIVHRIQESLQQGLWIDASHIEHVSGKQVFQEEKVAVEHLLNLYAESEQNIPVFESIIADLVKTDELLAKIAIEKAKNLIADAANANQEVITHMESAEEDLAMGQQLVEQDPAGAIVSFMQAWEHAQQVGLLMK